MIFEYHRHDWRSTRTTDIVVNPLPTNHGITRPARAMAMPSYWRSSESGAGLLALREPATSAQIVLSDAMCDEVQRDGFASIAVTFTCESVIDPH